MGVDIQTYRAKIGTYRHSHGVNVVTQVVVINFSHGLKIVGSVLFIGILLIMAGVEQNPGPKISDIFIFPVAVAFAFATFGVLLRVTGFAFLQLKDICFVAILTVAILVINQLYFLAENKNNDTSETGGHLKTEINEDVKTIKVSGLPKTVTDEIILMFFENTNRQGGGKVSKVQLNEKERSAIVVFEEEKAVRIVLEKQPIQILGCKVKVETINLALEMSERTRQQLEEEIRVLNRQKTAVTEQINDKVSLLEEKNDNLTMKLASTNAKYERLQCVCQADRSNIISLSSDLKKLEETCEKHVKVSKTLANQIRDEERQKEAAMNEVDELKVQLKLLEETRDDARHEASCQSEVESSSDTLQREEEPKDSEGNLFAQALQKLGLKNKYPGKISVQDVIAVDPNEATDQEKTCIALADIPWIMLKRLMCAHSECRDITASDDDNNVENDIELDNIMSFISDVPEQSQDLSPLDIFTVVYQCCDPFMKQIFFQRLYLCKIAVPFLYKHWETRESYQHIISVWPLRSLTIENRLQSGSSQARSREVDLLEFETKVLAFARFGRPRYSKSKLLNSLLSSQGCKTFFNIDCPSGMTPRNLGNGNIEMFWLPTLGDNKDKFQDAMTFMNMRGDLKEHFNITILSFISDFADAIIIITDLESILKKTNKVQAVLLKFSSVILVIADPLSRDVVKTIKNFESEVFALKSDINLRILSTHKGEIEQNAVDMVSSMSKYIKTQIKSNCTRSLKDRLNTAITDTVKSDEQEKDCEYGRQEAKQLVQQMEKGGASKRWKQLLTPVHSAHSQKLGKLMKKRERAKEFMKWHNIDFEIKNVRQKQIQSITKTVRMFIDILIRNEKSPLRLKLFLCWLHFYIEREKRKIVSNLMYENRCAWEKLKILKSMETKVPSEIENQEIYITQLEVNIDEASFSVEHFFREVGHIYEAILESNENPSELKLPRVDKIANIVGNFVVGGHQLELIDGESFYMPFLWTKTVLKQVGQSIGSSRVMTLSVLGLHSSGKSTLLNTMFGSQFSTRTGRCTRGIHVQLIPVKTLNCEGTISPFDYVLVVDTEGLRSPELSHVQHEHDNELATVITGIGDVTMLNIMGENTSEMRDILQVIVHAFLRLKMTNRNLDIRKSCAFIHQNVTDTSASQNMISGLSKLMQTLDEMTKEAARSEGILEISTFNQVIEFDITSQVWYLKNLWQGNPPMATVNSEYSDKVVDMKCKILQKALQMDNKSYKSLSDIIEHAHSLWKGVLNEDFVFSFRNNLEIRAYMEMEKVVQDELWRLESFIRDKLIDITHNKFASCQKKYNLRHVADKLINDLNNVLADERSETEKVIKRYFETNKYKDIIIKWKKSQHCRIEGFCLKLEKIVREEIEKAHEKRSVEILSLAYHDEHDEELRRKTMEVADRYKGKRLNRKEIDTLFDEIWRSFITKVDATSFSLEQNRVNMHSIFNNCLRSVFSRNHALLKEALIQSANLKPIPNMTTLDGSFQDTGIKYEDISVTVRQFVFNVTNVMKRVCTRVNKIFEDIDKKINRLCRVNDEITEMSVNKLMFELDKSLHDIVTGNNEYVLKTSFYVKLYVHVSRYAHPIFEKHSEKYLKTQGTAARLEQYKILQKLRFEAILSERQAEDHAAKLFSNVSKTFAEK